MVQSATQGPSEHAFGGLVTLSVDQDRFEFYIDAAPGHGSDELGHALRHARKTGLEALDPDEDEPQLLDDGSIRIWLSPIVADGAVLT